MVELKVRLGAKGQIVIPKIFRDSFKLYPKQEAIMKEEENGILITRNKEDPIKILEKIKNGAWKKAYTSTLTVDEFLWKVQKEVGRELAAEGTSIFFSLENLEL